MLSSNDRVLADELRSTLPRQYEPSSLVKVRQEGRDLIDRSRNYSYPDNIRATYSGGRKGKER